MIPHLCALAAGSDYFRARFSGPFKEEKTPEEDLMTVPSIYYLVAIRYKVEV